MYKKLQPPLFVVILLSVLMNTMGQDFASLRSKTEGIIRAKRPVWKLYRRTDYEKQVFYSWRAEGKGITILIFFGTTVQEAIEKMEFKNKIISVGPGKPRTGFGDEGYSSESGRGKNGQFRFRKDNVYVEITAPSLALAESIASSIAKEVRWKPKG